MIRTYAVILVFWCSLIPLSSSLSSEGPKTGSLLCKKCSQPIASASDIAFFESPHALSTHKQKLLDEDVTVQTLMNPHNFQFDVVTAQDATVSLHGKGVHSATWFPEHKWRMAGCPVCQQHLGWSFEPLHAPPVPADQAEPSFYGLILSRLVQQKIVDWGVVQTQTVTNTTM